MNNNGNLLYNPCSSKSKLLEIYICNSHSMYVLLKFQHSAIVYILLEKIVFCDTNHNF